MGTLEQGIIARRAECMFYHTRLKRNAFIIHSLLSAFRCASPHKFQPPNTLQNTTMKTKECHILQQLLTSETKLCSLKEIGTDRAWDYSLPTLTTPHRFTSRRTFASDKSFWDILEKEVNAGIPYRILKHANVFEEGNDLVLFGGALLDVILEKEANIKDFDLRLIGEKYMDNEEKCVARAKGFVASIYQWLNDENGRVEKANQEKNSKDGGAAVGIKQGTFPVQQVTVSRCRSTVTVKVPGRTGTFDSETIFQLTFAPERSVEAMLRNCQPQCSRLAIKDGKVVMDEVARYCIQSTCMVLDEMGLVNYAIDLEVKAVNAATSYRGLSTQIVRFIKYFQEKGFDLILPRLEMDLVPRRNLEFGIAEVLDMPSFIVIYERVEGNKIMATELRLPKSLQWAKMNDVGAYDADPTMDVGNAIHHNIQCLVNKAHDQFRYVAKGEVFAHVFDFVPSVTPRMVDKSYESVTDNLLSGSVEIDKLLGYFGATSPAHVVQVLFVDELLKHEVESGVLSEGFHIDKDKVRDFIQKEKVELIAKIDGLRESMIVDGLSELVVQYPTEVSTVEDLEVALYGKCKRGDDAYNE